MNEIKIRKFLDKKFKETSEEENFCYEEISLIYKIKINNFVNEVKIQKIFYLKTKKIVEKNCIVNGKFQGIREIFDKNGNIILRGAYLDGKKVGLWHEYENNKIKIRVAFDEEEKFSGLYKEYYQDGSLKEECIYIKGNLIKKYKQRKTLLNEMTKGFDGVKNNISKTFKIIFCYLQDNR